MNPYHLFLDLPETESSPDYYTLLGLPRFSADPKQIHAAAVERNSRLRQWDNSKHFREANLLLDEVVAAALVLENPERKAAYDAQLLRQLGTSVEAAEKQSRANTPNLLLWVGGVMATATAAILLLVAFNWPRSDSQVPKAHELMPAAAASPDRGTTDPPEDASLTVGLPVSTVGESLAVKDDPEANLTAGKTLCFVKGEWDSGLKLLAQSADADLKPLADKDLANPMNAADQIAVADGWWEVAMNENGLSRAHIATRAVFWYQKARGSVSGLTAVKIDRRIQEGVTIAAGTSVENKITAPTAAETGTEAVAPNHATTSGSFSAWIEPYPPVPGRSYEVVFQIRLPPDVTSYQAKDLTGMLSGSDGYKQAIRFAMSASIPVKRGVVNLKVSVPGSDKGVRNVVVVESKMLGEKQTIELK